ncbi:hypothetical protein B0H17DRAFT_568099 [Mycena rosella]|uniref:Uncharacterized protein n=1 Tax=Mycena rosella TaxID=1033263 RepID=A0AAD7BMC2_MYCRO|nr:hypothetical protein B0H17DRAFT_568099 [Mycena rosella]
MPAPTPELGYLHKATAPATGSPYDASQMRRHRRQSKPSAPPPPIVIQLRPRIRRQSMGRLIPIVTSTLPSISAASMPVKYRIAVGTDQIRGSCQDKLNVSEG